jgi:hypothetical protein
MHSIEPFIFINRMFTSNFSLMSFDIFIKYKAIICIKMTKY